MPIEITNDILGYHAKDGEKQILTIQIFEVTMPDGGYSEMSNEERIELRSALLK